jgi:superfamily II DNA or RNA helicase
VFEDTTQPVERDPEADLGWLRDYQAGAVEAVAARHRGILSLPTGAGKTEVDIGLVRAFPTRWLFLVNSTDLVRQAAERFEARNREHGVDLGPAGVIGEGKWSEGEYLTCATFQTLARGLAKNEPRTMRLLDRTLGLLVDECHTLPADSFLRVANAIPNAYFRVGQSGTPLARGDRKSSYAIGALGPIIYKVSSEKLVEEGVLSRAKVRMVKCVQAENPSPTFQGVYGACVVRSPRRNALITELAKRAEKPGMLFVKEIAHGKAVVKLLERAGLKAEFVWGDHSVDWRKSHIKRLVQGHFDILVCSVVFQTGIDVPELRSIINAGAQKSVIATLQRAGRGMRIERDRSGNVIKDSFELWDVLDEGNEWLEKHAKMRKAAYMAEKYELIMEGEPLALASA